MAAYVVSSKVVDVALAQHGVVLELGLPEGRSVSYKTHQSHFPKHETVGGNIPAMMTSLAFPERRVLRVDLYPSTYFPDFITSAKRELMESVVFLVFFVGASSRGGLSAFPFTLPAFLERRTTYPSLHFFLLIKYSGWGLLLGGFKGYGVGVGIAAS